MLARVNLSQNFKYAEYVFKGNFSNRLPEQVPNIAYFDYSQLTLFHDSCHKYSKFFVLYASQQATSPLYDDVYIELALYCVSV